MKRIAISKILFRVAILFCFGIGLDMPAILSAQQTASPLVSAIKPGPGLTQKRVNGGVADPRSAVEVWLRVARNRRCLDLRGYGNC